MQKFGKFCLENANSWHFDVETSLAKGIIFRKIGLANGAILKLWAAHPCPKFSREPPPRVFSCCFQIIPVTVDVLDVLGIGEIHADDIFKKIPRWASLDRAGYFVVVCQNICAHKNTTDQPHGYVMDGRSDAGRIFQNCPCNFSNKLKCFLSCFCRYFLLFL